MLPQPVTCMPLKPRAFPWRNNQLTCAVCGLCISTFRHFPFSQSATGGGRARAGFSELRKEALKQSSLRPHFSPYLQRLSYQLGRLSLLKRSQFVYNIEVFLKDTANLFYFILFFSVSCRTLELSVV